MVEATNVGAKVSDPTNWLEWVRSQAEPKPENEPVTHLGGTRPTTTPEEGRKYAEAALRNETHNVATAPEGTRNHTLNSSAFSIGQFVASGYLTGEEASQALTSAAQINGLEPHEIANTIRSGFTAAQDHPRIIEPLPNRTHPPIPPFIPPQPDTPSDTPAWEHPWTDLQWVAQGEIRPTHPPTIGARTDGVPLLYRNRINGIFGAPETAKTWIALHLITQTLNNGENACLIDIDHNGANDTQSRLIKLGADPAHIGDPERFRLYEPEDTTTLIAVRDDVAGWQPALCVLDSVGELLPMLGLDSNSNDDITRAYRHIVQPMATTQTAIFTIDHLAKHSDNENAFAIGGMAKKRAISGLYLHASARQIPAPKTIGRITLTISKDRSGMVREYATNSATGAVIGTFILDSTNPNGNIEAGIEPVIPSINEAGEFTPTMIMEKVSKLLEEFREEGCNTTMIQAEIGGKKDHVNLALARLVKDHFAKVTTRGKAKVYFTTKPFRHADTTTEPITAFMA